MSLIKKVYLEVPSSHKRVTKFLKSCLATVSRGLTNTGYDLMVYISSGDDTKETFETLYQNLKTINALLKLKDLV